MENEEPTIVEQEVGEVADTVTSYVQLVYAWLRDNILILESLYQIAVIVAALALAWLARRNVSRLLRQVSAEKALGPVVQRLIGTLAAISLPVVSAILLSVSTAVFEAFGLPIQFLRLVSSLLVAFIVIRIVAIFIPSPFWGRLFAWSAWTAAALNAVGVLDTVIEWLRATGLTIGPVTITAWAVVKGLMLTAVLVWGANAIVVAVERQLMHSQNMNSALRLLVTRLTRLVLVVLAVVIGLTAVGVDVTAFAVFSGALGIGVGLGLQRTAANLFASYSLLVDRSVKPGDVIEIETTLGPTYGVVGKMTTRYVSVRTRDGTETLIPNDLLISSPLTNWSHSDKITRRRIPVGVSYDADVALARQLCIEAAAATPRVLADPKPVCLMRGFGDSSIDLELRFWLNDPENGVANVASEVLIRIWEKFREHAVEVPFPQRDLHLRSSSLSSGELAEALGDATRAAD